MVPVLLVSLLLYGKPEKQVSVLKTVRMAIVLLLILYYYFLWSNGAFAGLSDSEGRLWEFIAPWFSPMLGYVFPYLLGVIYLRRLCPARVIITPGSKRI
ncbi:MAG: hypothetical protein OXI05_10805 [Bacteroidota bacterium]|nr:hypothetical protein [Bacteroidota bacterium]